jgi:hypothetical protein
MLAVLAQAGWRWRPWEDQGMLQGELTHRVGGPPQDRLTSAAGFQARSGITPDSRSGGVGLGDMVFP